MAFSFNKKQLSVTTYSKVVFLLVLVSVGSILLFSSLYYYTIQQEKRIYKNALEQYDSEINSLLKLNSEAYNSTISDISYWDEFVLFMQTKNLKWFNTSVANIIDSYKVDYISAYTAKGDFITKVSTNKIKTTNFIPKEVFIKLYEKKAINFFINTPDGIAEVYGASVHPSDDPFKNKTKPAGYFFMVRLLDTDYFASLEKISNSKISFYDAKKNSDKSIFSVINLKDANNYTIARLIAKRENKISLSTTKYILIVSLIAFLLSILIFHFYAVRWAKRPIRLIKKVLENSDESAINALKKIRGEFRYIGKLFEENLNQKVQLNKSKEKAEESDKLKTAFLTNLSHEIRTPMNAIMGFTDLLDSGNATENEQVEYRNIIHKSGKNLVSIIDDLIEMSKLDAKQVTTRYVSFDLDVSISTIINDIKTTIPKSKNLEIIVEKTKNGQTSKIFSDQEKIEKILKNLLSNAVKFTDKGKIVLFYEQDIQSNKINFYIIDSGIGIEKDNYEKIFKRFIKIENDHSIRGGGLGLGLTLTKAYIELLGGQIAIESEFGVSTTFKFCIPLLKEKSQITNSNFTLEKTAPKNDLVETILVAEDDNFNFLLIEKMLKSKNYKIIRAEDGEKAVEIISNNNNIDLILMDIKMPKLSGHQAFEIIKKMRPKLPIIAQTAFTSSDEVERIFKTGFSGYISKPIKKELLYQMIDKLSIV